MAVSKEKETSITYMEYDELFTDSTDSTDSSDKPNFRLNEIVSASSMASSNSNLNKSTFSTLLSLPPADMNSLTEYDTSSFTILDENSLNSIQASSLATYTNIKKKSTSIDYESMISSLNANEIKEKLKELLQENFQLKETLKRNNLAIKQQFNVLSVWQEEIINAHENHKQKLAESKQLISQLKQENIELKQKYLRNSITEDQRIKAIDLSDEFDEKMSISEDKKKTSLRNNELWQVLDDSIRQCATLLRNVEKHVNIATEVNCTMEEQNLKIRKLELNLTEETCNMEQNFFSSVQEFLTNQIPQNLVSHDSQWVIKNLNQYNNILQNIINYLFIQISCSAIQKCLKESVDVLDTCINTSQLTKNNNCITEQSVVEEQAQTCKNELFLCYKKIIDEQLKCLIQKRNLIEIFEQLQKWFCDYHLILQGLEIKSKDDVKLNTIKVTVTDKTLEKDINSEKCKTINAEKNEEKWEDPKQIIENLEEYNQLLKSEKQCFDMEHKKMLNNEDLCKERDLLLKENNMLKEQTQLYKDRSNKFKHKFILLQEHYERFCDEIIILKEQKREEKDNVKKLNNQVKEQEEYIFALRMQLSCYEESFDQQKNIKDELLSEKSALTEELQMQKDLNTQLQSSNVLEQEASSVEINPHFEDTASSGMYHVPCPGCNKRCQNLSSLQQHTEQCLNLD